MEKRKRSDQAGKVTCKLYGGKEEIKGDTAYS
jgi:hypothetical protein